MATLQDEAQSKPAFSNKSQSSLIDQVPHALLRRSLLLTPSFFHPAKSPEPNFPTAFLNGMRGFAALFVFTSHFASPPHPWLLHGYGGGPPGQTHHSFFQLPIIRLVHSGFVCVHVFFVVSGFSISLKAIKLMRMGSYEAVFATLVSATFRRTLRLYIPCFVLLGCVFILARLGAFVYVNEISEQWPYRDFHEHVPPIKPAVWGQLMHLVGSVVEWADILNKTSRVSYMPYAPPLWTIPVELKCSLITFACLLGLTKSKPWIRITTLSALSVYFYSRKHPEPTLFLGGALLAELHLIRHEKSAAIAAFSPTSVTEVEEARASTRAHKIKYGALFGFGLFLSSFPHHGGGQGSVYRPFYLFSTLLVADIGKQVLDLFVSVGALIVVYAVSQSPWIQRIFTSPLARYLGNISFGLYCVHQPLINWFGFRNMVELGRTLGYGKGWALAFIWQLVVTVWLGDLFWRVVDEPSVRFARWFESFCEPQNESDSFQK